MSRRFFFLAGLLACLVSVASATEPGLDPARPLIGMLQSDPVHAAAVHAAGVRTVVLGVSWDRAEPQPDRFDLAYFIQLQDKIAAFRAAGLQVVLDPGVQYPPPWIFKEPNAHFVNQYGQPFEPAPGEGECGVNLVFNAALRDRYASYLAKLFHVLGADFAAVRLGGGRYNELGYPDVTYHKMTNCYWAFDPLAQGKSPGLPAGIKSCPVPDWKPSTPSPGHASARKFLDWYMESLRNYHDWQIATVRRDFAGPIYMMYPSTGGLRPGQLNAAIADDANGSTGPEKTGEVSRGYDMARFVAGITDPKVVVYSTWIDGFPFCDDTSPDPARWNPGHFLGSLAAAHQPPLALGGENTGHPDDLANLELTFQRLRDLHLVALYWAFEPALFDGKPPHATIADFKKVALPESAPATK